MNQNERAELTKLIDVIREQIDEISLLTVAKPRKTSTESAPARAKTQWANLKLKQKHQLWKWAQTQKPTFDASQCRQAVEAVKLWALSNDKRKADWIATIQGAMREGWAFKRNGKVPQPGAERGFTEADPASEVQLDRMQAALKSLQAEEDRTYSMAEIEAEANRGVQ